MLKELTYLGILLYRWFKLNTDGSITFGQAIGGGVLRDSEGKWFFGFKKKKGGCYYIVLAKLWAVAWGLKLCA